jgi:acyl dehydratase
MTRPEIGASARRTRTVTRRDIELFTEISGDRNSIHYDDELAASSFRGREASSSRWPRGSSRRSGLTT